MAAPSNPFAAMRQGTAAMLVPRLDWMPPVAYIAGSLFLVMALVISVAFIARYRRGQLRWTDNVEFESGRRLLRLSANNILMSMYLYFSLTSVAWLAYTVWSINEYKRTGDYTRLITAYQLIIMFCPILIFAWLDTSNLVASALIFRMRIEKVNTPLWHFWLATGTLAVIVLGILTTFVVIFVQALQALELIKTRLHIFHAFLNDGEARYTGTISDEDAATMASLAKDLTSAAGQQFMKPARVMLLAVVIMLVLLGLFWLPASLYHQYRVSKSIKVLCEAQRAAEMTIKDVTKAEEGLTGATLPRDDGITALQARSKRLRLIYWTRVWSTWAYFTCTLVFIGLVLWHAIDVQIILVRPERLMMLMSYLLLTQILCNLPTCIVYLLRSFSGPHSNKTTSTKRSSHRSLQSTPPAIRVGLHSRRKGEEEDYDGVVEKEEGIA